MLFDAFRVLGGQGELYQSPVPEPFTFFPEYKRTVDLSDGSITSQFLEKFGRPGRDTGHELERDNAFSVDQSMYLLNSSDVQSRIQNSFRLKQITRSARQDHRKAIEAIYRMVLSRPPTPLEISIAEDYPGIVKGEGTAFEDLTWSLINSKEFLYRH